MLKVIKKEKQRHEGCILLVKRNFQIWKHMLVSTVAMETSSSTNNNIPGEVVPK